MSRAPSLKEGKKDTVDCEASFPYWRIVPREENRDKLATVVSRKKDNTLNLRTL